MKIRLYIALLSLINIVRSTLLVGQAVISKFLIDEAVSLAADKTRGNTNLIIISIIFGVAILSNVILSLTYFKIKNKFGLKIEVNLKKKIYDTILKKDISSLKQYHSGEISNVYLSDVANIKNGVCEIVPSFFLLGSRFILAFFALLFLDYKLLLILFVLGVIGLICARIYSRLMKRTHKKVLENDGKVNAFMQETYENMKVIKALDGSKGVSCSLGDRLKENYKLKIELREEKKSIKSKIEKAKEKASMQETKDKEKNKNKSLQSEV